MNGCFKEKQEAQEHNFGLYSWKIPCNKWYQYFFVYRHSDFIDETLSLQFCTDVTLSAKTLWG